MPAPPILAILAKHVEQADVDRDDTAIGELVLVCERGGVDYATVARTLYRYTQNDPDDPVRSLDFNTADRLLCGMDLVEVWRTEPFSEWYYGVDLNWRKCECAGCETWFKPVHAATGATGQRYCSTACRNAAKKIRRGESHRRQKNWRGTERRCRNGHARVPENIYIRPTGKEECIPCRREANRASYHARRQRAAA